MLVGVAGGARRGEGAGSQGDVSAQGLSGEVSGGSLVAAVGALQMPGSPSQLALEQSLGVKM